MKKLLFFGACLVALASSPVKAQAQVGVADFVVVKVSEGSYSLIFEIARANQKPEYRLFKLKDLDGLGGGNTMGGQAEATRQLLVELAQQGYILTTSFGTTEHAPTTLIFTKRQ